MDDEESITQLLCTALRYEGFDGRDRRAPAGRRSARRRAFRPDLVLLDVMLPGPRRLRGAPAARRRARRPRCRSSSSPPAARPTTASAGSRSAADDYVTKPFSLEELIARVRAVLRRTRGEEAAGSASRSTTWSSTTRRREVRRAGAPGRADPDRVQPAALPAGQRRPRAEQGADPRPRLELRLRRRLQRRRDLHQLPAQEGRPRGRAADPHGPRLRLLAAAAR